LAIATAGPSVRIVRGSPVCTQVHGLSVTTMLNPGSALTRLLRHMTARQDAPASRSRNIIVLGFIPVLALMVLLSVIGLSQMAANNARLHTIVDERNAKAEIVHAMRAIVRERSLSMYAMMYTDDLFLREEEFYRFKDLAAKFMQLRERLDRIGLDPEETVLMDQALGLIGTSQPLQVEIVDHIVGEEVDDAVRVMVDRDVPLEKQILAVFDEVVSHERISTAAAVAEASAEYHRAFGFMVLLGVAATGLGLLIAGAVTRRTVDIEGALFQEKERAEVTLDAIGDGVITTDARGDVVYLNPVAEQLTGWTAEEARGRSLRRVYNIVDEASRQAIDHPAMSGGLDGRVVGVNRQIVLINRYGAEYAVEDTAAPLRDADGKVIGGVLVVRDVTESRSLSLQLNWQASHDALTGLANRFEFELLLNQLIASAKAQGKQHALLYLDLDQFKVINDTCGHVAGDGLLKRLAGVMQPLIRESDTLARLGGDEFGVLLEGCHTEQADRIAQSLREAVQEFRFAWEDKTFKLGVSIGLVVIDGDSVDAATVLSEADAACYVAKDMGRNRVWHHQADDQAVRQRHGEMQWVARINEALENDRLCLFGQRIVPLQSAGAQAAHYELLVRMVDADGELVQPMAFIPAAERYGLMRLIDRWVIHSAFEWVAGRTATGAEDVFVAINLSGQSLEDDDFVGFVRSELETSGANPKRLCFEITETAAIANWSRAVEYMAELKIMGCRLALDDFGSGMASFGYLKAMPVDFIKIDGVFVRDMAHDSIDAAMVEAIHQIGHVMGKRTIAEFVESADVLERLREIGVDFAQGFHIHRPEPIGRQLEQLQRASG
jgi:diguanylate cyclase (GGDEF)-like protein/PAS domain S-box-containing protein